MRCVLLPNQSLVGKKRKRVLVRDGEYCVIVNPFDKERKAYQMGVRLIRKGPCTFPLYPMEILENDRIEKAILLGPNQDVICQALLDHDGHKAGEQFRIAGVRQSDCRPYLDMSDVDVSLRQPLKFIPTKAIRILQTREVCCTFWRWPRDRRCGLIVSAIFLRLCTWERAKGCMCNRWTRRRSSS